MYSTDGTPPVTVKKVNKKLALLLSQDSSDDEMSSPSTSTPSLGSNLPKPWLNKFKAYLDGIDEVLNGVTVRVTAELDLTKI